jgi:hypothetical protein
MAKTSSAQNRAVKRRKVKKELLSVPINFEFQRIWNL